MRRTLASWIIGCLLLTLFAPLGNAASAVSLADLQENIEYLFPDANYLSGLPKHSMWHELSRNTLVETSGIEVTYEAILDQYPSFKDELPRINAYLLPKSSTKAAQDQFNTWSNSSNFTSGLWEKQSEGNDYFTYYAGAGSTNDLIKVRPLEEGSLHLVSLYDNVLMIVNFYRPAGEYLNENVEAYLEYLENSEETLSILNEVNVYAEEALKFYLGTTFSTEGPSDYDYSLSSAEYSADLSNIIALPLNGTISLDLYIDDASEIGTVLSMNGISSAIPGMMSVIIHENAVAEFSFYEPNVSSPCRDEAGWHHLYTQQSLELYDWQNVKIGYGAAEGLKLTLQGELQDSCDVRTPRANTAVYLGDYPSDNIAESFVGYVNAITSVFSTDENGKRLDDTSKKNLIFADVTTTHPNAEAIQYLKEKNIIQGYSDGTFRPDQSVNRAEILKILFVGLDYTVPSNQSTARFKDLESKAWYLPYVNYGIDLGIINGYSDGSYRPAAGLNRVEFLKILFRAYGLNLNDYPITTLYPDTPKDAWYASYVQYAKDNDLMDPDSNGKFNPGDLVTRAEVAETLWRVLVK